MLKQRAFTLIELLVVVGIIGLFASIVLVNIDLPTQRQRARVAKTLEFSQSIQSALGSEAVGIWSFDNNALDASGRGNNGTIYGGASSTTDTPQKVVGQSTGKYALSFDGTNDYVSVGDTGVAGDRDTVTYEMWIKNNGAATTRVPFSDRKVDNTDYTVGILVLATNIVQIHMWEGSSYRIGTVNIGTGSWHHIAYVINQVNDTRYLYVDGVLNVSDNYTGTGAFNYTRYSIGASGTLGVWFNGLIDEVRIYGQALTIGQIQKHYAEGLENHKNIAIK